MKGWKKFLKKIKSNKDAVQSVRFLAAFLLAFLVLYITALLLLYPVELMFAFIELGLFSFLGWQAIIFFQEPVLMQLPHSTIQISFLCTGLLELTVLVSAILASFGIELEKKKKGIMAALVTVVVFNSARIFSTTIIIQNSSREIALLVHDVLFRASLFLLIAGFYGLWFYWATGKLEKKINKGKVNI